MPAQPHGPVLLAAYGTLMSGQINPLSRAARARMRSMGPCLLPGRLYEIREAAFVYPALVLNAPPNAPPVHGELFAIGKDDAEAALVLAETDAYENCHPDDPHRGTYRRVRLPVRYPDRSGSDEAWVYVYNRAVGNAPVIADGRWRGAGNSVPHA